MTLADKRPQETPEQPTPYGSGTYGAGAYGEPDDQEGKD